jgi:hypothetical protein
VTFRDSPPRARLEWIVLFRDSSTVEQEAVNFKVLGSNPSRGATMKVGYNPAFFVASQSRSETEIPQSGTSRGAI